MGPQQWALSLDGRCGARRTKLSPRSRTCVPNRANDTAASDRGGTVEPQRTRVEPQLCCESMTPTNDHEKAHLILRLLLEDRFRLGYSLALAYELISQQRETSSKTGAVQIMMFTFQSVLLELLFRLQCFNREFRPNCRVIPQTCRCGLSHPM